MKPANKISKLEFKKKIQKSSDLSDLFFHMIKYYSKNILEEMVREYRFHPSRRWRFDLAWVNKKIAVECDGGQFKALGGRHNTDADREKINTATQMGWRVLRFSGTQIKSDPMGCIGVLKKTLEGGFDK